LLNFVFYHQEEDIVWLGG